MRVILALLCWLVAAVLAYYLFLWVNYHFFLYDLDRRMSRMFKHPGRVIAGIIFALTIPIFFVVLRLSGFAISSK